MRSKFLTIVNWGVLVVIIFIAVWMVRGSFYYAGKEALTTNLSNLSEKCIDVGALEGFGYEACYDSYSEMIFLKVSRDKSNYSIDSLDISFVDLSSQFYSLDDVPGSGEDRAYKISAQKNPKNINVELEFGAGFYGSDCGGKRVLVDYCPMDVGGSIGPIGGIESKDFVEVKNPYNSDSDVLSMDLAEKEAIWESVCKSNWDCDEWGACEDGIQKRSCRDLDNCPVSIDAPISERGCSGDCVEDWECEWSSCSNGASSPECRDLNGCGTSFNIPKELSCKDSNECSPEVVCSNWTRCEVGYDFVDLLGDDQSISLDGIKSRVCVDKKGCVNSQKEERACSVSVDIYTERIKRCGKDYVEVHSLLDNSTLAVLEEAKGKKNYLNIYFNNQDGIYCDYCFDGVMDGDEEGLDCGGSCKNCEEGILDDKHWWDFLSRFLD